LSIRIDEELMKRHLHSLALGLLVASSSLLYATARAEPSATECLAASAASLKSDNEHRLRAERTELLVCAAASCPAEIRAECIRRIEEVNEVLPTITFEARDPAGDELVAVKVVMDDEVLAYSLDGLALAVDPGPHMFSFEAAGQPTVKKRFVIREAQKNRVELIRFGAVGVAPSDAQDSTEGPMPAAATSTGRTRLRPRGKVAIAAASLGVAALGVGIGLGVFAKIVRDDAQTVCPGLCRNQDGVDRWQRAKRAGNLATAGFIVGGVSLTSALLIGLTGRREVEARGSARERRSAVVPSVEVEKGLASLTVSGRW
jgi:hypothetical protein